MSTVDLSDDPPPNRRWIAFIVWTIVAVFYATILHFQIQLPFDQALSSALEYFYGLALLMIPVRRASAKMIRAGWPMWRQAAAQIAIGVVVMVLWMSLTLLFHRVAVGPQFWQIVYADNWPFQLLSATVIYLAAVGLMLASLAFARSREHIQRAHELEVAARDAQLSVLKAQFQPHFMLNALNSLIALIDKDPALARTMAERLADLMKSIFERESLQLVPLSRELDLVRAYLDIERIRLGARLSASFTVDDAALSVLVPPFLLQPIVENAVKHGVAPFTQPGRINVSASIDRAQLRIVVTDSGGGGEVSVVRTAGTGRGLQITRSRLDGVYGDAYRMTFTPGAFGAAVEIQVPAEIFDAA